MMRKAILTSLLFSSVAAAQVSTKPLEGDNALPGGSDERGTLPGDNVIPSIGVSKDPEVNKVILDAHKAIRSLQAKVTEEQETADDDVSSTVPAHPKPQRVVPKPEPRRREYATPAPVVAQPPPVPVRPKEKVFTANARYRKSLSHLPTITLPSNSAALATAEAGVKVGGTEMRFPLRLDYAFLGPNKAVVELTGCKAWVTVTAERNVERLYGETADLSCRTPSGRTFNIPFTAHMVDQEDEYVGVEGRTVMNGKVTAGLLSFMNDGVEAFGKAMAAAQVTTKVETSASGEATGAVGANVTGSHDKYVAGQTIAGATGRFLNWFVDYYQGLQPTIEVPPGRKLFLITDGEVQIPKMFFGETISETRLNTTLSLEEDAE